MRCQNNDGLGRGVGALGAVVAVGVFGLAAPVALGQSWERFTFGGAGDVVVIPITVTDDFPQLQVTDGFLSGDQFLVRVLDGGRTLVEFETSVPTVEGDQIGDDFDAAFDDPRWSSGEAFIGARGALTLEMEVLLSPFGGGGAGWRLAESACRADLDGDGELTIFDFLEFQNLFDAGDPLADFDGDGELTLFDFLAFQNAFDAGCA